MEVGTWLLGQDAEDLWLECENDKAKIELSVVRERKSLEITYQLSNGRVIALLYDPSGDWFADIAMLVKEA